MLGNIKTLILSHNRISSCAGLDRLFSLETLALDNNRIRGVSDVARLVNLPQLMSLTLEGNPLVEEGKNKSPRKIFLCVVLRICRLMFLTFLCVLFACQIGIIRPD